MRKKKIDQGLKILMLLAVAIIAYWPSFNAPFQLDDLPRIVFNPVFNLPQNVGAIWNYDPSRFLTNLTLAINFQIGQGNPPGYHIVNFLLHLLAGGMVYLLSKCFLKGASTRTYPKIDRQANDSGWPFAGTLVHPQRGWTALDARTRSPAPLWRGGNLARSSSQRPTQSQPESSPNYFGTTSSDKQQAASGRVPFLAAAIFLLHPIQTSAVTYTVQRATVLAGICVLVSLVFYCRWRTAGTDRMYWFSVIAGFAGAFCKPIVVILPLLILLLEYAFFTGRRSGKHLKERVGLFFCVPLLVWTLVHLEKFRALDWQNIFTWTAQTVQISRLEYLLTQLHVIWTYLRLLVIPIRQNIDYDYPVVQGLDPATSVYGLGLAAILALGLWLWRKSRLYGAAIFWFFITLLPESSFIPLSDLIFEHRLYLPMFGFSLAISIGIVSLVDYRSSIKAVARPASGKAFAGLSARRGSYRSILPSGIRTVAGKVFLISPLLVLALLTYKRNLLWSDQINFLRDVASKSPQKARVHNSLAIAYAQAGAYGPALAALQQAIALAPDDIDAYNNRANIYRITGQMDLAIQEYSYIIAHAPNDGLAFYFRSQCWAAKGEQEKAAADLKMARQLGIM